MSVKTSIILPSKNKVSRLKLVLLGLKHQIDPGVEIVIVLDGCSAESLEEFNRLNLDMEYKTGLRKVNFQSQTEKMRTIKVGQ